MYNSGKLEILAANSNFGDPLPGVKKYLEIRYKFNG
jgi:hypothetical protein